jgi:hypothetical protein
MRASDNTIDTVGDYNFGFMEAAAEPMEIEELDLPPEMQVTKNTLLDACDATNAALIIITRNDLLIRVDPMEGAATPAMLELAMIAHKLFSFSEEALVTHLRNAVLVIRQPGAHNPFQVSEVEPTRLRELFTEMNARKLSADCHIVMIMQDNQGKITAHSQCQQPFNYVPRLQYLYSIAKSIETNARGIFASIVPHLNEADRAFMDRVSKAVDAL